jgi:hypothetical protein
VTASEPSLSREAGAGTAVAHGSVWTHILPFVFAWSMYTRVPDLQGTDSGPQAHLGRGSEPAGGANIFFPAWFF